MLESDKFDRLEFYNLANKYFNEKDEAKLRTGINRYYFSSFCTARDYLLENNIFLNKKSEKIMKSKKSDVHYETRKTFKKNAKFNGSKSAQIIGKNLEYLRKKRNKVYYDSSKTNLESTFEYCKRKTEKVLKLLSELN